MKPIPKVIISTILLLSSLAGALEKPMLSNLPNGTILTANQDLTLRRGTAIWSRSLEIIAQDPYAYYVSKEVDSTDQMNNKYSEKTECMVSAKLAWIEFANFVNPTVIQKGSKLTVSSVKVMQEEDYRGYTVIATLENGSSVYISCQKYQGLLARYFDSNGAADDIANDDASSINYLWVEPSRDDFAQVIKKYFDL